jgi:hypothetical protein
MGGKSEPAICLCAQNPLQPANVHRRIGKEESLAANEILFPDCKFRKWRIQSGFPLVSPPALELPGPRGSALLF